jgi:hypothetical protein
MPVAEHFHDRSIYPARRKLAQAFKIPLERFLGHRMKSLTKHRLLDTALKITGSLHVCECTVRSATTYQTSNLKHQSRQDRTYEGTVCPSRHTVGPR